MQEKIEPSIHDALQDKTEIYRNVLEVINQSTDDFLFVFDIAKNQNWFFGEIDRDYALREEGCAVNSLEQMYAIVHPSDLKALQADLKRVGSGKQDTHNMNYRWINRRGEIVWVNCRGKVIPSNDGTPGVMVGRVSEETLRHLYNPLTGLWNKTKLREDMAKLLKKKKGYLMLIDIDGLAAINLRHGREFGDALLKEMAVLLEEMPNVRTAYHINQNNFALVLDVQEQEPVLELFRAVRDRLVDKCSISAGAVPISRALFADVSSMLDSVKLMLAKAKQSPKERLEFFSQEQIDRQISSLALFEELKESEQNGCEGFELYYQPQLKIGTYELCAVEALLRYRSKSRGRVFPDEFIPLLEDSRLINSVGLWVLDTALKQCKKWRETLPELRVSVNFSILQFEDPFLAEKVMRILAQNQMPGSALTIEITESLHLQNSQSFRSCVKYLSANGVDFAIDDFGTGYSNIAYLKELDIDEIKVDRLFVKDIEKDTHHYHLIGNVIEFAKAGNIRVCCEGVETTHELAVLEALSPDLLQGYLFEKPLPAEEIERIYVRRDTEEYKKRESFVQKLYRMKEELGVIHFDPKDILRQTDVGLWIVRIDKKTQHFEMHADETMERVLGMGHRGTPAECYAYWHDRIKEEYVDYVHKKLDLMTDLNKVVQLQYPWRHPKLGEVMVRSNGRRVEDADGMIVLEGYHRIVSNIEGAQES